MYTNKTTARLVKGCFECHKDKVLGPNNLCRNCTESYGLRICVVCKELKLIQSEFDFSGWNKGEPSYKRTCIDCYDKGLASLSPGETKVSSKV